MKSYHHYQINVFSLLRLMIICGAFVCIHGTSYAQADNNFFDVTKAGVKNDGSEDSKDKIIQLLGTHKKLYFPKGNYLVNGQIEFEGNNIFFKGDDSSTTKFIQKKNYSNIIIFKGSNCSFRNIGFVQTGYGDESKMFESYGSGICILRGNNNIIENCSFTGCGDAKASNVKSENNAVKSSAGVYISGGKDNLVTKCKFTNSIMGVNVDDYQNFKIGDARRFAVSNNDIKSNLFTDCNKGVVIDFGGADGGKDLAGGTISDNVFEKKALGDKAILLALFNNTDSVIINNNNFKGGFNDAIGVIKGSRNVRISNNNIDNAYSGITLYSSGFYNRKILIANNTITNSAYTAIALHSSGQIEISGNKLTNNKTAISLSNYADSVKIKQNLIDKINTSGIALNNVVNVDISDNELYFTNSNSSNGIIVDGAIKNDLNIVNNHFSAQSSAAGASARQFSASAVAAPKNFNAIKVISKDKGKIKNLNSIVSKNTFEGMKGEQQLRQ